MSVQTGRHNNNYTDNNSKFVIAVSFVGRIVCYYIVSHHIRDEVPYSILFTVLVAYVLSSDLLRIFDPFVSR